MENVKLRLDFFFSLGFKLHKGDEYTLHNRKRAIPGKLTANTMSEDDEENNIRFINSFASRKNMGERPCDRLLPVDLTFEDHECDELCKGLAREVDWIAEDNPIVNVTHWKPDLEALIKLQIEHDKKSEIKLLDGHFYSFILKGGMFTGEYRVSRKSFMTYDSVCTNKICGSSEASNIEYLRGPARLDETIKQKQGDKVRIEYRYLLEEIPVIDVFTFQFETEIEICVIDSDGHIIPIDKECFIAYHPLLDEMEVAKERQVNFTVNEVMTWSSSRYDDALKLVNRLQVNGYLAEITLPIAK